MLFEVFFDSRGKLRHDFKEGCVSELSSLQRFKPNAPSFELIAEYLLPYACRFHALSGEAVEVAVDVALQARGDKQRPHVAHICIASGNLLHLEDEDDDDERDEPQIFRQYTVKDFEKRISSQLMIPHHLLSFTYTGLTRPKTVFSPDTRRCVSQRSEGRWSFQRHTAFSSQEA